MAPNPFIEASLPIRLICRMFGHRLSRGYPVAPYMCERCGKDLRYDDRPDDDSPVEKR